MTLTIQHSTTSPWRDDAVVAYAIKSYTDGATASEIAKALRASFGLVVTRNAVIGALHRRGVMEKRKFRATETQLQGAKARKIMGEKKEAVVRRPKPLPPRAIPKPETVETPHARPWQQRRSGQCTWPIETERGVFSCCGPIERGSFCYDHARIGYDTVRKLDVDRAARHMTRHERNEG